MREKTRRRCDYIGGNVNEYFDGDDKKSYFSQASNPPCRAVKKKINRCVWAPKSSPAEICNQGSNEICRWARPDFEMPTRGGDAFDMIGVTTNGLGEHGVMPIF